MAQHDEAEALRRRVLDGRRARLGRRHPDTLQALGSLVALLHEAGRDAEADFLERADRERLRDEEEPPPPRRAGYYEDQEPWAAAAATLDDAGRPVRRWGQAAAEAAAEAASPPGGGGTGLSAVEEGAPPASAAEEDWARHWQQVLGPGGGGAALGFAPDPAAAGKEDALAGDDFLQKLAALSKIGANARSSLAVMGARPGSRG